MSFAHFMATLKLGMEWRLQDQTRGQRQGDFKDLKYVHHFSPRMFIKSLFTRI